jgi:hypothetical protein
VPIGSKRLALHIWNRFGKEIRTLIDEQDPAARSSTVRWDRRDDGGESVRHGSDIYRVTIDGEAESRVIALRNMS